MKKLMRLLLLAAILSALLCVGALAAESEPVKGGIYGITGSVTLTPKDAGDKEIVSGSSDGVATDGYYADAVKFDVKASELTEGQQYLLLVLKGEGVPTAENIAYIDQAAAQNGSVSFTAYPKELTKGTYHVYLVGGGTAFNAAEPGATFQYDKKYTLGDVDDNGVIDATDALLTLQHAAKLSTLQGRDFLAADVDKNQVVDGTDALMILQRAAKLIDKFPD